MNVIPQMMKFPVLCLSQRSGFSIVRNPQDFCRSSAALVAAGYFEGLRVVDASGAGYDVIDVKILKPRSEFGKAVARLFDATVRVDPEMRPAGQASLNEVRARVSAEVAGNPEEIEEMTGHPAEWWNATLARCASVEDMVRAMDAAAHTA